MQPPIHERLAEILKEIAERQKQNYSENLNMTYQHVEKAAEYARKDFDK